MPLAASAQTGTPMTTLERVERKLELAQRMHELQPIEPRIDNAINTLTEGFPDDQRNVITARLKRLMDIRAIEVVSVETMAEIYTLAELEAMVAYYELPEARSAVAKDSEYGTRLGSHIFRMVDRALMELRTGEMPAQ